MHDPDAIVPLLNRLRDCGLRIAIDDFGTGNAVFTYFLHLPLTELKIDQSFVTGLHTSERAMHLVESMITLAHKLQLRVVAEGVDSAESLSCLRGMGCDRSEEHTSELQSLMRTSYAVFCWNKKIITVLHKLNSR